ncbi:alpha/beta fold hydrolase [Mycolicibacterium hippocampi]|uniref:Beta-ketoadipate enol-lactone hydrolase n=1 Tax=Mycolicibacterium hippocampi TaxID=659824 RepID=A0A850PQL7_9MYCO|nr:alpha/beta fold hydrolase [Mycolicibacterium hippocampi]NVN52908.1 Beta-ketoadipate enol-lactone hydrolase [Mycolicibacterium hippocampi]
MPHFCSTDSGDAQIAYLDSGGNDCGAPIIFVPGFTDVADDYTEMLPSLGRRAAIVELRGHGRSQAAPGPYDSDTLGRDVGAVVDAITDGPVHVMTFSRGTTYALAWVLTNPDRVRSISIGDYVPEEIELTEDIMLGLLDGRWRGTPVRDRVDHDAAIATVRAARTQSFWEPLSRSQIPLMAVRSPSSPVINDANWARYRRLFPEARLHEFANSPHDIFRPVRTRFPSLVREHMAAAEKAIISLEDRGTPA